MSQKKQRGLRRPMYGNSGRHDNGRIVPNDHSDVVLPGSTYFSAKVDTPQRERGATEVLEEDLEEIVLDEIGMRTDKLPKGFHFEEIHEDQNIDHGIEEPSSRRALTF